MDANLTQRPSNQPSGHLTRIYNAQEQSVIDPFRSQYMDATSPTARKTIAKVHIFSALFNYWSSIGQVIDDIGMNLRSTVCFVFWKLMPVSHLLGTSNLAPECMVPTKKASISNWCLIQTHWCTLVDKSVRGFHRNCFHYGGQFSKYKHTGMVPVLYHSLQKYNQ